MYEKFYNDSLKGKRLQKNGMLIKPSTLKHYSAVLKNLKDFEIYTQKTWLLNISVKSNISSYQKEKKHFKNFYVRFTSFLYHKSCTDNYVGLQIKNLRSFFSYISKNFGYLIGDFYKDFYTRSEEIPIIVLSQEQLKFMIYNLEFEKSLPNHLIKTKDIFVIGCCIGLRFSDLINLRSSNLEIKNEVHYIVNISQKTNTSTRIKIPDFVYEIFQKYSKKQKTLLPSISLNQFNRNLKNLTEIAGWTYSLEKKRSIRGIKHERLTNDGKSYRFCDYMSSHIMRKTAITTMLILGMSETLVRKISGHALKSKDFYKYVNYSEAFIDKETDKVFDKLVSKTKE